MKFLFKAFLCFSTIFLCFIVDAQSQMRITGFYADTGFSKFNKVTPGYGGGFGFNLYKTGVLDFRIAHKPNTTNNKDNFDLSTNWFQYLSNSKFAPFFSAGIGYQKVATLITHRPFTLNRNNLYTPIGGGLEIGLAKRFSIQVLATDGIEWNNRIRTHQFNYNAGLVFKF